MALPTSYHYDFHILFGLLHYKFDWTDITYSNADLDIADVDIKLQRNFDKSLLNVQFPAIKHWEIDAH